MNLPPSHPQRQRPMFVLTREVPDDIQTFTVPTDSEEDYPGDIRHPFPERRPDFSLVRAKGALLRRILLYAAFGALVGASVAILVAWMRQ